MLAFHDDLNPRIWASDKTLRPEVRVRLLRTAIAFYRFLGVKGLALSDIILTGSNAAYNYTDLSDVDLHLVVDYSKTSCPDLAADFFDVKRVLWNQTHSAEIRGHKVELYVEDRANPAYASGVYSVLQDRWVKRASPTKPTYDDAAVAQKTKALASEITALLDGDPHADDMEMLLNRLRDMRRSGLMAGGEFSVENLSYKGLRALGLMARLMQAKHETQDRDLSLTEVRDEDMPDALASLGRFMADRRPAHQKYQEGDVLMHDGKPCDVVKRSGERLVLRPKDGGPTRIARDQDCEPAPLEHW